MTNEERMKWQVQKQSSDEVLFTGESWEEANEAAKLLTRIRHYNHNLLIVVGRARAADRSGPDAYIPIGGAGNGA
jgi:hypothetical protein